MMLGKTAGGLFWMFRYLERAENTARLLEAGWRTALTRSTNSEGEWKSIVATAGMNVGYEEKYGSYTAANVIDYMLRDTDNPSSVMTALDQARSNGRMVRTALSSEVWEATNECWMSIKAKLSERVSERNLHDLLTAIRHRTSVVRGALHGTMLRNDIFSFARLGTFIERADNTARILDVKYYVLLPSAAYVGSDIDNAQWDVMLRSVSADRAFRWLHTGSISPKMIADFMIRDKRMPRSLAYCFKEIDENLQQLHEEYCTRQPAHEKAEEVCTWMRSHTVEDIFQHGLHEFLGDFSLKTTELSSEIEKNFRFYG